MPSPSPPAGPWRLLLALFLLALIGTGLFRAVPLRSEMADFLPPPDTPASAFLLDELQSGAATTVILAGIQGAPEEELARLSRAVGEALRGSGRFTFVGNGALDLGDGERELLFRYRYLLSPAMTPELFTEPVLRQKLEALIDGLRSSASPLLARFGFADPAGAFFALLQSWLGESRVELRHGVWFAGGSGRPRALIVARTAASGLDVEAQRQVVQLFQDAFAAATPAAGARLLVSGPAVFSAEAAAAVRADVEMITWLSGLLVTALIWWRYRSLLMLAVVALPLAAGTLAGFAMVALVFGAVHGAALGFGMTMLGVTVDYPILLISQRRPGEHLAETARRIRSTLGLAALSAALGLTAMIGSGFAGLAQLGLFGGVGLLVGAATTIWLLPLLVPETRIVARPLSVPVLRGLERVRGRRGIVVLLALAALGTLSFRGIVWEDDLARLSPVPQVQRDLDAELRTQLGAPDVSTLVAIHGPDAETVLRKAEQVGAVLAPLVNDGRLGGFDSPARYLPSMATQGRRQAVLPSEDALRARLATAMVGLPFRPTAFDRFTEAVRESHGLAPLQPDALDRAPLLKARLGPLLSRHGAGWQGLVIPSGLQDAAAFRQAMAELGDPAILPVVVKAEMEGMVATTTGQALRWAGLGGIGVLLLLAIGLREEPGRVGVAAMARAAAPVLAALLVTLALLPVLGERLNPFHLVALLLLAGVGMDYSLFLGRSDIHSPSEASRVLGSVLNCTLTTLLTFGLLGFCQTPVLRGIGLTVSLGVIGAFLFSLAMAPGHQPRQDAQA